jgi:amidase
MLSDFIDKGRALSSIEVASANMVRREFTATVDNLFHEYGIDTLLVPTLPAPVPTTADWRRMAEEGAFRGSLRFATPADLTGIPTVTFPAGVDMNGMPVTMQLYGPRLSEVVLCKTASAFQRVTDWHFRHPIA